MFLKKLKSFLSISFMTVTLLGLWFILYGIFYWLPQGIDRPYEYNKDRIPKVYANAGFNGTLTNFEQFWNPHKTRMHYLYTEEHKGELLRYHIGFIARNEESTQIPSYTMDEILDDYVESVVSYTDNNDIVYFSPFFYEALIDTIEIDQVAESLKKALEYTGAKDVEVGAEMQILREDDKLAMQFEKELKADVSKALDSGLSPVLAIHSLDAMKYFHKGFIRMSISARFENGEFFDYLENVDSRYFEPGIYQLLDYTNADRVDFKVDQEKQLIYIDSEEKGEE